jgi:hypothetical protein
MSLMSFAVGQVGDGKSIATRKEVVHARHPQRLEIQKMAGVFLGRPLRGRSTDHHVARNAAEQLFQPRRSTPQADAQVGVLVDGNVELESPFKPGWTLIHAPRIGVLFDSPSCSFSTMELYSVVSPLCRVEPPEATDSGVIGVDPRSVEGILRALPNPYPDLAGPDGGC